MAETERPQPDALLAEVARAERGRLKVFLGAAPGVGKTYAMLQAAREQLRQGVDLAVGVVETHGRPETEALLQGLEVVPRRRVAYRGHTLEEMDLDALLDRRPALALVDELAHSNVPGSRHPKRCQDIEELLDARIDVYTTVNIQHLESLNDLVRQITRVPVRETVPNRVLERASDVVLIDLPPRELIERLHAGKVYVPDLARSAIENFFSPSNLTALRELAMRTVAERVDADMRGYMAAHGVAGPLPARPRILACVDGSEESERVVRAARRLAERQAAPWVAAFVETGDEADPARRARVERAFSLAEGLGGESVTLRGSNVADELIAYAERHNVTTLVLGRTRWRPLTRVFNRTISQQLFNRGARFEMLLLSGVPLRRRLRWWRALRIPAPGEGTRAVALAALGVAAATGIAAMLARLIPTADLALVYLGAVVLTAARAGVWAALASTAFGALAFNFFFTEPRYSLDMFEQGDVLTLVLFLLTAVITGNLAAHLKARVLALRETRERTDQLLELSRQLAAAGEQEAVFDAAVTQLAKVTGGTVAVLLCDRDEGLPKVATASGPVTLSDTDRIAAGWAREHGQPAGLHTDTLPNAAFWFLPLMGGERPVALLAVSGDAPATASAEGRHTVEAMGRQVALAAERTRLVGELQEARVTGETERLRSALLASISHDLRTPLASIIGSATSLLEYGDRIPPGEQQELLRAVLEEAERLNRYIQNLLDMTRLGHGGLKIQRDWVAPADIVASALNRLRSVLAGHRVEVTLAPDLPLLFVHPALIEQALVNVVENAARYAPGGTSVRIEGRAEGESLTLDVIDEGPGIPPEERARVFDMFHRIEARDRAAKGTGLGLTICQGLIGAHGGTVEALEGPAGRGTRMRITLPLPPEPAAPTAG